MSNEDLIIPEFRLLEDVKHRAGVIERAAMFAGEMLPLDEIWLVTFTKERERRRKIQQDLAWVFNGQWGEFNGYSPRWAHALIKYEVLLPIKLSAKSKRVREQAHLEKEILDCIVDYELMIKAAYRVINSRNQPLRLFAEFITAYQHHAGAQGCVLESTNQQQYDEAVYGYGNRKAA